MRGWWDNNFKIFPNPRPKTKPKVSQKREKEGKRETQNFGFPGINSVIKKKGEKGGKTEVFIPLTVGGGIRELKDIYNLLDAGCDKVSINSAAIKRPQFIEEGAKRFGSQCP